MDARGDYYGQNLVKEKSGHSKALHLKPFMAAAQDKGEVLFLAQGNSEGQGSLASTFILPSNARYYLDGVRVPLILSNDGLAFGAFRLTAVHSSTETKENGLLVMYAAAADTPDDAAFAAFLKSTAEKRCSIKRDGTAVKVEASGSGARLTIEADTVKRIRTATPAPAPASPASTASTPGAPGTFWIDGRRSGADLSGEGG
jgi:hypothetical protein